MHVQLLQPSPAAGSCHRRTLGRRPWDTSLVPLREFQSPLRQSQLEADVLDAPLQPGIVTVYGQVSPGLVQIRKGKGRRPWQGFEGHLP